MAGHLLVDLISSRLGDLAVREEPLLEGVLQDLEKRLDSFGDDENLDKKSLWVKLVVEGHRLKNDKLCLLMVEKLDLLDLMVALDLDNLAADQILQHVAKYFQLEDHRYIPDSTKVVASSAGFEIEEHSDMREEARTLEIEEEFDAALFRYEKMGLYHEHLIRLTMKHLSSSTDYALQKYCATIGLVQNIWFEYLVARGYFDEAAEFGESCGDKSSRSKVKHLTNSLDELSVIPRDSIEFLGASPSKWSNKTKLDTISASQINRDTKILMAELVYIHLERHNIQSALALTFILNEPDLLLESYLAQSNHEPSLESLSRVSPRLHATSVALCLTSNFTPTRSPACYEMTRCACLALGLLNETMRLCALDIARVDLCATDILQRIEGIAESNSDDKLNSMDPTIRRDTLDALLRNLKNEDNKELSVNVISVILCAIRIFLKKYKTCAMNLNSFRHAHLDIMFESLSTYLSELKFSASDKLVHATNNLVIAIKDMLDALADNEIIRESFKTLVDTVAGQCLIEARYKSAALLYSQIGDNMNAIKSLMRTGEIQTVVDYALLVRDITVNRITINFMRHLRVEPNEIEDFLRQSKL